MADGQFGEGFAVERDFGFFKGVYERRVGDAVFSSGCVDARDGERSVLTLFELSVARGVVEGVEHGLFSDAVPSAASGAMAFGGCEDGLVALSSRSTCFYSGHV